MYMNQNPFIIIFTLHLGPFSFYYVPFRNDLSMIHSNNNSLYMIINLEIHRKLLVLSNYLILNFIIK